VIRSAVAAAELAVLFAAFAVALWAAASGWPVVMVAAGCVVGSCAVLLAMHDPDSRQDDR